MASETYARAAASAPESAAAKVPLLGRPIRLTPEEERQLLIDERWLNSDAQRRWGRTWK